MEFVEFQKMLLDSLKDEKIKAEFLKLLSDDNVAEQLKAYEDKIKALEDAAKAADEKYKNLLSDFNDVSGTSAAVKLESENKDKKIAELNDTIAKMTSSGSDAEKASAEQITKLTAEIEELKKVSAEKDSKVSALSASETALKSQVETLSSASDDMKKQLESSGSEKNAEIGRLTDKVTSLSAELEAEKAKNAQAAESASAKEAQFMKDKSELEAKLAESAAAGSKAAELQKTVADMDVKIVGYVSEIDKLKTDCEQKDKTISELKSSAESQNAELISSKEAMEKELADIKSKYESVSSQIDTYKKNAEEASAKLSEVQNELTEKDNTIATINTQLQSMMVLRQKINEYAETANAYAEEVENARNILTERETTINTLNSQIAQYDVKIEQYTTAIETKDSQIEEIGKYAESLKAHAEDLSGQVVERNNELNAKTAEVEQLRKDIEAYNLTFGDLTKMFEKYQNLTPATKQGLSDVFNEDLTVRSFLSSGAQWGHIQALWEFTQQKINNEDFTDITTLNSIFKYFLDFHNSSYPTPIYALLDTKPGDAFDDETHLKVMSREERKAAFFDNKKKAGTEGPVKEVVLHGFKNLKNGRIIKQSLVKV